MSAPSPVDGVPLGRALLRVLGPVGRACQRVLLPVWRLARRTYDRVGLWLLLCLVRPVGRVLRRLLTCVRPVVVAARRAMDAFVDRLEPAWEAVLRATAAVDRAVDRLGQRLRRFAAPVLAALDRLGRHARG